MSIFEREYAKLNSAQMKAVNVIDGPMLVIAGPGTGKTQLLGMRVANIIRQTDIAPSNILCLTFTDNAARNMRERLETIIGQAAYYVGIYTFHSFGDEIINQYPDYFLEHSLLRQIDELGSYELLREIFEELPHSNPLAAKVGDEFVMLKDALSTISWLKQNALTPSELHKIIQFNKEFMANLAKPLAQTFSPQPSPKHINSYQKLLKKFESCITGKRYYGFPEYAAECADELKQAINNIGSSGRYAPSITAWRNKWCTKDASGQHVFKDSGRNIRKMHALASIYQNLLNKMRRRGLYDFDDMIMEVVHVLENNQELKFNLQERYQYILVDEFQDTNKAQLRMLQALGDNQIFEKRPNIMTVGDDDQAIYSFQGAEVSNMSAFAKLYRKPKLITLTENYRSSKNIVESNQEIVKQITNGLSEVFSVNKQLLAANHAVHGKVEHYSFASELAQYEWIADEISKLLSSGIEPEQIAILAPRHRYLERVVPYLGVRKIPIAYERRENILEAPIIKQLLSMTSLIVAIAENKQDEVDALIAEVLSFEFWKISNQELIELSIHCYNRNLHWLPVVAKHKSRKIRNIAQWFTDLARRSTSLPLEYVLDELIGIFPDGVDSEYDDTPLIIQKRKFVSPMRRYYFGQAKYGSQTDEYLATLGQLSSLRYRLREWLPNKTLFAGDLVTFASLHQQANIKIIDTNPHTQATNAVQVMTAYKAKGLEFGTVFIINAQDEVWGPTARNRQPMISLPKNLPIAPASSDDNDKLRLLYVAMSRAKQNLVICSYERDLDNRLSPPLSFISNNSIMKPQNIDKPVNTKAVEILSTDWAYRYRQVIADKPTLFEPILRNYKFSVTHLNNFIDVASGGPQFFLTHNLLRFPSALTPSMAFGDSMHKALQWAGTEFKQTGKLPTVKQTQARFNELLSKMHLRTSDFKKLSKRGQNALRLYMSYSKKLFDVRDLVERGFNNDGVIVAGAPLSGKIDKIHFVSPGQAEVIDFKTGKPAKKWTGKDEFEKIKLHKYRQQLLFYKLLVENSASFGKNTKVVSAALEFIEPDENRQLADNLKLEYDQKELDQFTKLIGVIWQHIIDLNFPNTSKYSRTLNGIQHFESDLINAKI